MVRGEDPITLEGYRQVHKAYPGRTVYDRVADHAEQTLGHAWSEMPIRHPMYFVHGLPGDRNAMHQKPDGDIEITRIPHWFSHPHSSKDTSGSAAGFSCSTG